MGFLRRVAGLTRLDMAQNSDIRKSLGIQPLLLQIEKSLLRWLGHVLRMRSERKARHLFFSNPTAGSDSVADCRSVDVRSLRCHAPGYQKAMSRFCSLTIRSVPQSSNSLRTRATTEPV
ncbi:unnamed protein product [Soboliphyme baturini]|uniref:Uncharacterized protein n=1 Tax=Soboliphyme baturini TaxID=241478 RepID=A0A183J6C7_9BILA|nr:unnamed protein product [Soboliphyme baturini]